MSTTDDLYTAGGKLELKNDDVAKTSASEKYRLSKKNKGVAEEESSPAPISTESALGGAPAQPVARVPNSMPAPNTASIDGTQWTKLHLSVLTYLESMGCNRARIPFLSSAKHSAPFKKMLCNNIMGVSIDTSEMSPSIVNIKMIPLHVAGAFALVSTLVQNIPFDALYEKYTVCISNVEDMAERVDDMSPEDFSEDIRAALELHSRSTVSFVGQFYFVQDTLGMSNEKAFRVCGTFMNALITHLDTAAKIIDEKIRKIVASRWVDINLCESGDGEDEADVAN
jgi:hypothetical protein